MLSLTIFQNIAMIIAGTVSITVACSWPKGIARSMFLLFVAGFLLIPPITQLLMMPFAVQWGYRPSLWGIDGVAVAIEAPEKRHPLDD